ncbi:MAG: hypothetical protein Q4A39_00450 [Eubacteriales bacterium]|nr:hypothetical protein [Eubacteriales bacterium]
MIERKSIVNARCVVLDLSSEPTEKQAEYLVRAALDRNGKEPWRGMHIDVFPGTDSFLVIARPTAETHIYIDEWIWRRLGG